MISAMAEPFASLRAKLGLAALALSTKSSAASDPAMAASVSPGSGRPSVGTA